MQPTILAITLVIMAVTLVLILRALWSTRICRCRGIQWTGSKYYL